MNHALGHLCVAVYALKVFKAPLLKMARGNDALADVGRRFALFSLRYVAERHRRYLRLYVYAVKQRSADFVHISLYLSGRAHAAVRRVAVIPARTGIHRSHEHKRAWIFHRIFCPAYCYMPVFKRLPHDFKHRTVELRQLVAEQHTVMGKRNFSRLGIVPATDKSNLRYGMMRSAKRPLGNQGRVTAELAGDTVYYACFCLSNMFVHDILYILM